MEKCTEIMNKENYDIICMVISLPVQDSSTLGTNNIFLVATSSLNF